MIIGEIKKGDKDILRVSTEEYQGKKYLDIRLYFQNDKGEMCPTKKGITISKSDDLDTLSDLILKGKAALNGRRVEDTSEMEPF